MPMRLVPGRVVSTVLRVVAMVLGVLLVALAAGVWVLGLLPASAPKSASEVLAIVGAFGCWLAMVAAMGDDR